MINQKLAKTFGALMVGGALAIGGVASVSAAEGAAGVKEHMDATVKTTKGARDSARASDKEGCLAGIKQAKQHYKEITGDAAGKPLQDAMKRMRDAQEKCEAGDTSEGASILSEVVTSLEKIQANIK